MLGRHSDPDGGDHPYLDHVGRDSFYGFLASAPGRVVLGRGLRRALLPGQRATQRPAEPAGDGVAPAGLRGRLRRGGQGAGGLRPALEGGAGRRPGGAALRQEHPAAVPGAPGPPRAGAGGLRKSLAFARQTGYLRSARSRPCWTPATSWAGARSRTPTTCWPTGSPMLAAHGRRALLRPEEWAREHDLARYFGASLKGEAGIDWDDPRRGRRSCRASSPTPTAC